MSELIRCPAHPDRYATTSSAIMDALQDITPDIEVFSVDEAFLDVTHCQRLLVPPLQIARLTKQKVFAASGILCSVGISGDKTTAKVKWTRLDGIYTGRWDRWFPVAVKIPVKSFMEKDLEGHSHWYDLTRGQWIQGLVASNQQERRLYVVTIEPELAEAIHDRRPRIMSG